MTDHPESPAPPITFERVVYNSNGDACKIPCFLKWDDGDLLGGNATKEILASCGFVPQRRLADLERDFGLQREYWNEAEQKLTAANALASEQRERADGLVTQLAERNLMLEQAESLLMRFAGAPTAAEAPWSEAEAWAQSATPAAPAPAEGGQTLDYHNIAISWASHIAAIDTRSVAVAEYLERELRQLPPMSSPSDDNPRKAEGAKAAEGSPADDLSSLANDTCGEFKVTTRDGRYVAARLDGFDRLQDEAGAMVAALEAERAALVELLGTLPKCQCGEPAAYESGCEGYFCLSHATTVSRRWRNLPWGNAAALARAAALRAQPSHPSAPRDSALVRLLDEQEAAQEHLDEQIALVTTESINAFAAMLDNNKKDSSPSGGSTREDEQCNRHAEGATVGTSGGEVSKDRDAPCKPEEAGPIQATARLDGETGPKCNWWRGDRRCIDNSERGGYCWAHQPAPAPAAEVEQHDPHADPWCATCWHAQSDHPRGDHCGATNEDGCRCSCSRFRAEVEQAASLIEHQGPINEVSSAPEQAAGERCRATSKNGAGSVVQCVHPRNHLGIHEGLGKAWPNQAEDYNGWADEKKEQAAGEAKGFKYRRCGLSVVGERCCLAHGHPGNCMRCGHPCPLVGDYCPECGVNGPEPTEDPAPSPPPASPVQTSEGGLRRSELTAALRKVASRHGTRDGAPLLSEVALELEMVIRPRCTCGAASEPDYGPGDCVPPCPRALEVSCRAE